MLLVLHVVGKESRAEKKARVKKWEGAHLRVEEVKSTRKDMTLAAKRSLPLTVIKTKADI